MRNGRPVTRPLITPRRFWPSVMWLAVLTAGALFSCVFQIFPFFTAVLAASFIGLNEFGRWSFRTNLTLCAVTAVVAAIAGVFSWMETVSIFVLFLVVTAYILHYRDRSARLVPALEDFAADLADAPDHRAILDRAQSHLQDAAPDAAVFIVLADSEGGLYIPEHEGFSERVLRRNGGTPWKVFASGRISNVAHVETGRDQPLDRDAVSLISVPITARGVKLGVLQLEAATTAAFSEEDGAKLALAAMILGHELYMYDSLEPLDEENAEQPDEDN